MKLHVLKYFVLCTTTLLMISIASCKKEDSDDQKQEPIDNSWKPKEFLNPNPGFTPIWEGDSSVGGSVSPYNSTVEAVDIFKVGQVLFFSYLHKTNLQGESRSYHTRTLLPNGYMSYNGSMPVQNFSPIRHLGSSYRFCGVKSTNSAFGTYTELVDLDDSSPFSEYGTYNPGTPRYTYDGLNVVHDPGPSVRVGQQATGFAGYNDFTMNRQLKRFIDHNVDQTTGDNGMKAGIVEPIYGTANYIAVFIGRDSIYAFLQDTTLEPTIPVWGASLNGISGSNYVGFVKESYSGNKVGICFASSEFYLTTISFDAQTNTFTKVLDNTQLTYSGTGTDFDIDEFGNAYYSGTAGNGSNTTGVSIYKQGPGGNTLIGGDNFMKTGGVDLLKFYHGKVYLAITSPNSPHVSFLKQD